MRRTMRWLAGGLGFLLPCFWLGATALLYAWFPGFRGSGAAFCLILILALILTGAAGLTAPTGWRGRILRLAVLETLLLTQVAFVNVWWNGRQVVRYAGPVGYNDDFGPYFKFGLYRDDSDKSYAVYFNRVRLGGRREDVDFYHYASRGVAAHRRRSLLRLCSHSDDLWRHQNLPEILNPSEELLQMTIPAHGVQLYKLAAAHK